MRFAYRHFIVISEESIIAAMGTECAAEQDKFWEFHDAIFDNWLDARQNAFAYSWLQGTAQSLNMDSTKFQECMESGRAFERVKASQLDGMERGIDSTPSVFVNGNRVSGDYEAYRQAIEDAIKDSQQ